MMLVGISPGLPLLNVLAVANYKVDNSTVATVGTATSNSEGVHSKRANHGWQ